MDKPRARAWLAPLLKPLAPVFREVLLMSLFVNILALGSPLFVQQVYDRVVTHAGTSTLEGLVIGMAVVMAFDYVLRQTRARILQTVALRIDVGIGRGLFNKLLALPLRTLESRPAGFWQALFRDVEVVRNTLSGPSALLVADLPFVVLFLVLIVLLAAPIAWVMLVTLPLFALVAWRSASALTSANTAERKAGHGRDGLIAEIIGARATVKALSLDDWITPLWEERQAETIRQSAARGTRSDGYVNLTMVLMTGSTILLITTGALAVLEQKLTMGSLIATSMLSSRMFGPINQLVGSWKAYAGFRQSLDRLGEVFSWREDRGTSAVALTRPRGEITLEAAGFGYGPGIPSLDNLTLTIKPHGLHAIVGPNGSGKTTLLKLLQGLYPPASGRVLLDGADIAQFTRRELANWIGYVPQDNVLFAGSLRDNIAARRPDASDEDILKAALQSGVHHMIVDLPDGYATEIGEAGARLSAGQRQRIVIARALLGDPPVMLLDEPSASLDRQAEEALRETLTELAKDHTILVVTHSPILLAACHNIIALDKGRIKVAGPSAKVLPRLFPASRKAEPVPA